jgi:hypothetical protein
VAQKVSVLLVDDIDGTEAHETVSFALDGTEYEIDLSKSNADDLRMGLAAFTSAARVTSRRKGSKKNSQTKVIREWAREVGIEVPVRGTLSADVIAQYEAAH